MEAIINKTNEKVEIIQHYKNASKKIISPKNIRPIVYGDLYRVKFIFGNSKVVEASEITL